jgi:hypothetical protein
MQTMTRGNESSAATGYVLVAFELSQRWWKVGFTTGMGHRGAHAPDRRRRARAAGPGHRRRQEDVWAGGGGAGDQLLRSRSGSRDYAGGQCARAAPDGATGVGLAAMAIRQCAGAVVSAPLCHRRFAAAALGIVALARKLLIALWRYVDQAIVPEGARLTLAKSVRHSGRSRGARYASCDSRAVWLSSQVSRAARPAFICSHEDRVQGSPEADRT